MNSGHDIYNPPPAPIALPPPAAGPIPWQSSDMGMLLGACGLLVVLSTWAWANEPTLGVGVIVAGSFVIVESWLAALTFLHRHPGERSSGRRSLIFLAALSPWLAGLGLMAAVMLGLFKLSDWLS